MKEIFKLNNKQQITFYSIIAICLTVSIVIGIINPPFLINFANTSFSLGVILGCFILIRGFFSDHRTFNQYKKQVHFQGLEMSLDEFKKEHRRVGDPLLLAFIIVFAIGVISSLIVIY